MKIACPFLYDNGEQCTGHIVRIEVYKVDIAFSADDNGDWMPSFTSEPRSHFHMVCSEKGYHAGSMRPDDSPLKFYFDELPEKIRASIKKHWRETYREPKPIRRILPWQ